jgi:hypothetical protein
MDRWSFVSDGKRYSAMQRDNHGGEYYRCEDADQQIALMQTSINKLTAEIIDSVSRETQTLSTRLQDVQECLRWLLEYNDTRSRRIAFKVLFDGFTRKEAVAEIDKDIA